jgi:hypothetical protein
MDSLADGRMDTPKHKHIQELFSVSTREIQHGSADTWEPKNNKKNKGRAGLGRLGFLMGVWVWQELSWDYSGRQIFLLVMSFAWCFANTPTLPCLQYITLTRGLLVEDMNITRDGVKGDSEKECAVWSIGPVYAGSSGSLSRPERSGVRRG